MVNYVMNGVVTRSQWLTGPKASQEVEPIKVGAGVIVTLNYNCSGSQPSDIVESINYSVTIGEVVWKSDGFLKTASSSSGAGRWMNGNFPNINLKQVDFVNPLQHITGDGYAQTNDNSTISLSLKEGEQESEGLIESNGNMINSGLEISSSFVVEYMFKSKIINTPIINNITIN